MPATDPRLVALYDIDNPPGDDHEHYRGLADRLRAKTIIDLGCGTGILTTTLTGPGRTVTGIDPDAGMLEFARRRPTADRVTWVDGDSRAIGAAAADLVVMTGNVAQHIIGADWKRTLTDICNGLRPGGTVAFESRYPPDQAWLRWDRAHTHGTRGTAAGPLTEWLDVVGIDDQGNVTYDAHNVFEETGEHLMIRDTLAFRTRDQIAADLETVGLTVRQTYGGWHRQPLGDGARVMVFEATRDVMAHP